MPGRDGTGPVGRGRGLGRGNSSMAGSGGFCVCPSCGEKMAHQRGMPCNAVNCPKCGTKMIRE